MPNRQSHRTLFNEGGSPTTSTIPVNLFRALFEDLNWPYYNLSSTLRLFMHTTIATATAAAAAATAAIVGSKFECEELCRVS